MRRATLRSSNLAVALGVASLFAIGYPAEVRAQTIFCPPTFTLTNGSCINGDGQGAFSGAALASQALTEVSQTTTQVTTNELGKAIVERREQERERMRRPVRAVPREKTKPAAIVTKAPPPPEPAARFGTWAQVYGDYQKRDAAGPGILDCCNVPGGILGGSTLILGSRLRLKAGRARLALWPALISPPGAFILQAMASSQGLPRVTCRPS